MSEPPDFAKEQWNVSGKKHSVVEANETAHKALDLAEKLEKAMDMSPGKFLASKKVQSWMGVYIGGILSIACLISVTYLLYKNQNTLSSTEHGFLTGGLMLGSVIGIGILFVALACMEYLGDNLIHVSVWVSSLALGAAIFMMIVAIKSRTLPG
jgi:hypothetical protein